MKVILSVCSLTLAALGFFWVFGLRVNATASMPRGIYRLAPDAPERGDLVSVCLEQGYFAILALDRGYLRPGSCPNGLEPLLKRVAGMPGDHIEVGQDGIAINGRLWPQSRAVSWDSHGRPMPEAGSIGSRTIPESLALVLSDWHPGGFDSRYFGLVPMASLRKVEPVFLITPEGE
ncbi:conjugative transfer signal peptidase TraF [Solidesulfovibrio sp.]|uniref:conjugative transfer signal peptidase TraF n=1 Tax=Solidesulfovibrio sp. TaxID=2910990 RepID=UPI0026056B7A|nr:conjugative transfer signal peptidase TraF [Solidesulfovibrio sp.]